MFKILGMLILGLVLFAASAGGSWYLQSKTEKPAADDPTMASGQDMVPDPNVVAHVPETIHDDSMVGRITAETALRLSASIKNKEKQLKAREELVEHQEKRLKFMIDDLQRERDEIDAMLKEAETHAQQLKVMLSRVPASTASTPIAKNGSGDSVVETNTDKEKSMTVAELKNLRKVAEWFKSMPPQQAAESIREMCNEGKMEMVVHLLSFLEERDAADILGGLDDASLVTQLAERFQKLERPEKKK